MKGGALDRVVRLFDAECQVHQGQKCIPEEGMKWPIRVGDIVISASSENGGAE